MSKHTSGPWRVHKRDDYVAQVWTDESHGSTKIAECAGLPREANACLIAAAPELLAACRALVNAAPNALQDGLAAIAKAEGKEGRV